MDPYLIGGLAVGLPASVYAASCFAEVRGVHDWLYPGAIFRTAHPHVVLTFDDGPHPERTPRLLDVLAEAGVKAVFFVIGERAEAHPTLLERMAAEGHQIGNHSWSHPWFLISKSRRIEEEIDRCQTLVEGVTGTAPTLVRPPYGQRDFRCYRILRERELTPVLWNRNLRDYYHTKPAVIARRLARARPGDVVMCHDGDPLAPHTIEGVERWLATDRPPLGLV